MTDTTRRVTELDVLRALSHEGRTRLMDALRVHGPSTASVLAEATGLAVGSVSHHMSTLARAGLVEEATDLARDRRERWWRLAHRRLEWSGKDFGDSEAARTAVHAAEMATLAHQFDHARRFAEEFDRWPQWRESVFATQSWMWLRPEELRELNGELLALLERYRDRDHEGRQPVLFFARAFPSAP